MKFSLVTLTLLYSSLSVAVDLTPHITYKEIESTDYQELLQLYRTKFGYKIPYTYKVGETTQLKGMEFTELECFQQVDNVSTEVEDCNLQIWRDTKKNKLILSRLNYVLPATATPKSLKKSIELPVSYLHLLVSKATGLELKFDKFVLYKGQKASRFTLETKAKSVVVFISNYSGKILGKTTKSKIHTESIELYPLYEGTLGYKTVTEEEYLIKTEPVLTQIDPPENEVQYSIKPIFSEGLGSYSYDNYGSEAENGWTSEKLEEIFKVFSDGTPTSQNGQDGWILKGKYVTVLIDSDTNDSISNPIYAPYVQEKYINNGSKYNHALYAKPIENLGALGPIASNNPTKSFEDNYDALHVYHGTEHFFKKFKDLGYTDFSDKELFLKAYLYSKEMKNNAFFDGDSINFTTYSGDFPNYARSNRVIWHELGHSVFRKLVKGYETPNSGGGVNEGTADFMSYLLARDAGIELDYPGFSDLRIFSPLGFGYANETHDDGMAFGGSLKDILESKIKISGKESAILKMTDLLMTTFRLVRNNLKLNETEFFSALLFADEYGSEIRQKDEFKNLINEALSKRNFSFNEAEKNVLHVKIEGEGDLVSGEVTQDGYGSGNESILLNEQEGIVSGVVKVRLELKNDSKKLPFKVKAMVYNKDDSGITWISKNQIFVVNDKNEELQIPVKFSGKCKNYNMNPTSCGGRLSISYLEEGTDWSFAKRAVFFDIEKNAE